MTWAYQACVGAAAGCGPRSPATGSAGRRILSNVTSPPRHRTGCGWPISPTRRPTRAGCMWRSSSTPTRGWSSAGKPADLSGQIWPSTHWRWRCSTADALALPCPGWSTTAIWACNTCPFDAPSASPITASSHPLDPKETATTRHWFHTAPSWVGSMRVLLARGLPMRLTSRGSPGVGGW